MSTIRLIKHEVIPKCGSFEVRFPDGRPSRYFYWDDLPSRRLRPDLVDGKTALEQAKAFALAERDLFELALPYPNGPATMLTGPPHRRTQGLGALESGGTFDLIPLHTEN